MGGSRFGYCRTAGSALCRAATSRSVRRQQEEERPQELGREREQVRARLSRYGLSRTPERSVTDTSCGCRVRSCGAVRLCAANGRRARSRGGRAALAHGDRLWRGRGVGRGASLVSPHLSFARRDGSARLAVSLERDADELSFALQVSKDGRTGLVPAAYVRLPLALSGSSVRRPRAARDRPVPSSRADLASPYRSRPPERALERPPRPVRAQCRDFIVLLVNVAPVESRLESGSLAVELRLPRRPSFAARPSSARRLSRSHER